MFIEGIIVGGAFYQRGKGKPLPHTPPSRLSWEQLPVEFAGIALGEFAERHRADVEQEWQDALFDALGCASQINRSDGSHANELTAERHFELTLGRWEAMEAVVDSFLQLATAGATVFPAGAPVLPRNWDGRTPFRLNLDVDAVSGFPRQVRAVFQSSDGQVDVIVRMSPRFRLFTIEPPL
jgi:hypothetical protein